MGIVRLRPCALGGCVTAARLVSWRTTGPTLNQSGNGRLGKTRVSAPVAFLLWTRSSDGIWH